MNSISCRDNPSKVFPTGRLSGTLCGVGVPLEQFGANAPSHMGQHDISFSILRGRSNSRAAAPFSFSASAPPMGGTTYCVTCAGSRAGGIVLSGVRCSPLCDKGVRNIKPHCYPDFRSGVVRFPSGGHRRLFIRPYKLSARRLCLRKVSSSLPRTMRLGFLEAVGKLRRIRIVEATCTVRCSYISPLTLGPSLRFLSLSKLFNTKRFGNSSNCRRTTTRNLVTNVGTTQGTRNGRPFVLSHTSSCVNALVSSLIAGNYSSPCEVVASHSRCELLLERSGTSVHLAPLNCRVKLISRRGCRQLLGGRRVVETRHGEVRSASVPLASRLRRLLISHKASPLPHNIGRIRLLGHPRVACSSLAPFSMGQPSVPHRVFRRIRVRLGCRNCVIQRATRVGRVHQLRIGTVPPRASCGGVSKLQLRTERGLSGVQPVGINRTSEVDNISPTSVSILLVCLTGRNGWYWARVYFAGRQGV